jgi:hypothetical protein
VHHGEHIWLKRYMTRGLHLVWLTQTSCLADADLWMRPAEKPDGCTYYYEYELVYVDDILILSHKPIDIIK